MHTVASIFWAKKADRNGRYQWLPLGQHLEDTFQIAGLLWEHWLSVGQKEAIISTLTPASEELAKKTLLFLAAVHDLGKVSPAFQTKKGWFHSLDFDQQLIDRLEYHGFKNLSELSLANSSKSPHALVGQVLLKKYGVKDDIASIIGGHHGRPVNSQKDIENQLAYGANYYQVERESDPVHCQWDECQQKVFDRALIKSGMNTIEAFPRITQAGQVLLSGLLIVADWISSNENYFPLLDFGNDKVINQKERVLKGWQAWSHTNPIDFCGISDVEQAYNHRFNFSPRTFQEKFYEIVESTDEPGIFILEAPMGLGKTEAALIAAEQLAEKAKRSGLFFALPTQATSDAIFPRIRDWLQKLAEFYGEDISIQLMHGKASLNEDFSSLARQVDLDDNFGTVTVNSWFSGRKKSILDDFVVGTIDQFLLIALKQKHLALRHLGFSKKVVIIDEAHASDTYMNEYLMRALNWMGAYGVPVIVLSATLPQKTRKAMIFAYLKGKKIKKADLIWAGESLTGEEYPLVTYTDKNQIQQFFDFEKEDLKEVKIVDLDEANLWGKLDELSDKDGIIGIIVNTVKKAQEIGHACVERYGKEIVEVLHSSFIATDRKQKEKQLLETIGKHADRPTRKIIIGTQVIEQSLDIDFDVLISDLAPMDLLIQRIGRLHRHNISRPAHYRTPILYVMGITDDYEFDSGSVAVYGEYLLMRTQYYLPNEILIPDDISPLVQKVYGDESLDLSDKYNQIYEQAKLKENSEAKEKKIKAGSYRLSPPDYVEGRGQNPPSLIGWLKDLHPDQTEEKGYAQVRDSDERIEIIAIKKCEDGYRMFDGEDNIADQIADDKIARLLAQRTVKLPGSLSQSYNIEKTIDWLEKFNAKYLSSWQAQPWLKGQLGIVFDENNEFFIEEGGYVLTYDEKYGLSMERREK